MISIHSPHARGDLSNFAAASRAAYFNPLPSCEGRRFRRIFHRDTSEFQSTPLMRGETDTALPLIAPVMDFNPLPSCEGRPSRATQPAPTSTFQSTPLMRGETNAGLSEGFPGHHFNPLPSCEGRLCTISFASCRTNFNPLPSCEGRRFDLPDVCTSSNFNPLPSCEGRPAVLPRRLGCLYFNPLPSCEGRRLKCSSEIGTRCLFQSTPLMRGETVEMVCNKKGLRISIHSPHARGDTAAARKFLLMA